VTRSHQTLFDDHPFWINTRAGARASKWIVQCHCLEIYTQIELVDAGHKPQPYSENIPFGAYYGVVQAPTLRTCIRLYNITRPCV